MDKTPKKPGHYWARVRGGFTGWEVVQVYGVTLPTGAGKLAVWRAGYGREYDLDDFEWGSRRLREPRT